MKSILEFLKAPEVTFSPGSAALLFSDKSITYSYLETAVNKKANYLTDKGVRENDLIPILSENNSEFIITVLALWEIGAIPVPLNNKLLHKELNEQIRFLESKVIFKSKLFDNISFHKDCIAIPLDEISEPTNNIILKNFRPHKTALILFTSGSSGKPKAVELSFNNLIQSSLIGNKVLNRSNKDRWLASLPFYHIGGFSIIIRALTFRTSIIIPDSLSNDDLIQSIKKHKPTLVSLVSNQLKRFVDEDFIPDKGLRMVLLGGGFSDKELILKAIEKGWRIAKVYGSTESASFISFMNTEETKRKPQASGKEIPPNKIFITDEGEIAVKGPTVMKGYFKNDEETDAKLKNEFYFTGDMGHLDDEGYLFVEARRDDLIISGGENIIPYEIEKIISNHPKVKEVCVVGLRDKQWGQALSAVIVLKEKTVLTENELKNFLRERITSFKIPKKIFFVKQLPKSELGKVQKDKVVTMVNSY